MYEIDSYGGRFKIGGSEYSALHYYELEDLDHFMNKIIEMNDDPERHNLGRKSTHESAFGTPAQNNVKPKALQEPAIKFAKGEISVKEYAAIKSSFQQTPSSISSPADDFPTDHIMNDAHKRGIST